jgi:hypothetical protein
MHWEGTRLLFVLLAVHCLCDFALQSDTMGREKKRSSTTALQAAVPWYYWLTAHALIHGLGVMVVTQSLVLSLAESVGHFLIDFGKCEGKYGIAVDQALHVGCKVAWWLLIVYGGVS